jgi:hypothetical protein
MKRFLKFAAITVGSVALLAVGVTFGASYYYTSQYGQGCASCHEMAAYVSVVHVAPHRTEGCMDCHEASVATKLRHMRIHFFGAIPENIRMRDVDLQEMTASCRACHQQEYASWHAGPHSATYSQIFADPAQNSKQVLMDDCLRCHGMHFNDSIRDLVQPLNTKGPWRVIRSDLVDQPAMPCMSCHQIHREGAQETKPGSRISVTGAAVPASLAFYDRRESLQFAATALSIPQLYDGARIVTVSQDPRQALCYQCHAPRMPETGSIAAANAWGPQVGSGDDRTPMGVHEGLSCISCHDGHSENTRASCKTCHPQMSHCGIDVEKMDTTFASATSAHNIHWVKCTDCHQHGIPKAKAHEGVKAKLQTSPGMNG